MQSESNFSAIMLWLEFGFCFCFEKKKKTIANQNVHSLKYFSCDLLSAQLVHQFWLNFFSLIWQICRMLNELSSKLIKSENQHGLTSPISVSIDSDQQEAHTLGNHCHSFRSNGFLANLLHGVSLLKWREIIVILLI